ncbi:hypothetical protein GGI07_005389 [Coemansia sp. Benny D115]|nr:hypothetical protein GGI07_005389 [Coemansia sp. Benny D115]
MSLLARLTAATVSRQPLLRSMSNLTEATKQAYIPRPRGKFTSSEVFLKTIGRGCEKLVDKFPEWDQLFKATSETMKNDMNINAANRKWILMWTNKYRLGIDPYFIPTSKKHTMKRSERLARAKRRRGD